MQAAAQLPTFRRLWEHVRSPLVVAWIVTAPIVAAIFIAYRVLVGESILPLLLFAISPWPDASIPAAVAGVFLVVSFSVAAGRRAIAIHGPIILALFALAQAAYTKLTWSEGVLRYGITHTTTVNVLAFGILLLLAAVYLVQRRTGSIALTLTLYAGLALWPVTFGFPFLFEGP